MFNFFNKKDQGPKIKDRITMDEEAKFAALLECWKTTRETVFICWFSETLDNISAYFKSQSAEPFQIVLANEAASQHLNDRTIIFCERYPLHSKEKAFFEKLQLPEIIIYSSLSEPLFKSFGSEKIIGMMKQLGMKREEVIEHKMISKSITGAQEKIEAKVEFEMNAHSQQDWMEKNIKSD